MDHTDHISLHKICDADKYTYQEKMDRLYAQVNNDLVLSLESVNALYEHLWYFFDNFEQLPEGVRQELGEKWKHIVMYHLNQRPQVTNTDGDGYWKLRKGQIEQWWSTVTHNDIEYLMMQDKSILKDLVLHISRRLKKYNLTEELLSQEQHTTTGNYMIPLRLRGQNVGTNQLACKKSLYDTIISGVKWQWWVNLRGVRDQTNGKYILWMEEWKKWYDVQHKYLLKAQKVIDNEFGNEVRNMYVKTMKKQVASTIQQRNTIQIILGDEEIYQQKSRSFHGMHEEMTKVSWMMGDRLKMLLLDDFCYL